ncbi:MAG: cytochrome C biogenesis protein [Candidatus Gottesmanbacteria bacterium GW2011_GWA2_43_14]|uniref:Cytochrome C biogenesis protein n=1 Tax=Candidatus Gottesmanbacteria bacterium GW2011_GWA2_43_14 TaxID=1618443 RepID=A0A0G1G8X0_9BACT|nr:MAG: cytochrome C biogenesis protein [Candidatus Gottesmanbacteria bacterium GW2011_GWA2_43_14]
MPVLLIFAFISGLVTILAPCIWPLLPIILSASRGGKAKSLGITVGVAVSFAVLTLTISYLVSLLGFDPDILRFVAVVILLILGLSLLVPAFSARLEAMVSKVSSKAGGKRKEGNSFLSGFVTGASLGIVWSPCAGPILATIATLASTRAVNSGIILVTIFYVAGLSIPLFFFSYGGNLLIEKSRLLNRYTGRIRQFFGLVIILTALSIYTNYDKVLQVNLLDAFPSYSTFLFNLEGNKSVSEQLSKLKGTGFYGH